MQHLYRLHNSVKNYAWGHPEWIPSLIGAPNPQGEPWAELWMGAHPASPSFAETGHGEVPLDALIAENLESNLGKTTAEKYSGIPFLFKLLAAARPLSIQAHPNLDQARAGWERENRAGIPLDAPNRNYKDPNHKPEILCALTPFSAMCGFRELAETARLLDTLAVKELDGARSSLEGSDKSAALRAFLESLFSLSAAERVELGRRVALRAKELVEQKDGDIEIWELVQSFAAAYPEDPAVVSPLYLNVLALQPGEAIYLPAGILHAYVEGFGVELMANSDNVLRGGLTPKHVDLAELTRTLRFAPFHPEVLHPETEDIGLARYRTPCGEFSLSKAVSSGDGVRLPRHEPHIVVLTEGAATLHDGEKGEIKLSRGESAFISAAAPAPILEGSFAAYVAGIGRETT